MTAVRITAVVVGPRRHDPDRAVTIPCSWRRAEGEAVVATFSNELASGQAATDLIFATALIVAALR
jgi:hypothetical protein